MPTIIELPENPMGKMGRALGWRSKYEAVCERHLHAQWPILSCHQ